METDFKITLHTPNHPHTQSQYFSYYLHLIKINVNKRFLGLSETCDNFPGNICLGDLFLVLLNNEITSS